MLMNQQVETFFNNAKKWKEAFLLLREIVCKNELLQEEYKWIHPCYTPGRQKAYLFYFNQAKQSKTRTARIEKYYQHILEGKGLHD